MEPHKQRYADWAGLGCASILAAATIAAYAGTFSVPLLFDDIGSIVNNASIRHWSTALRPPLESTSSGRPVLNASLALNAAMSGTAVGSYHAVNLLIHVLAGLTLFGIVRRTVRSCADSPALPDDPGRDGAKGIGPHQANAAAFCIALLWLLHPLQTESVTYVIQRAESLMGLFCLLTLYCFIRHAGGETPATGQRHPLNPEGERRGTFAPKGWAVLCVFACLLGMATKEVMASAPLIVLLYDRTFVSHSFRESLRRRWRIHAALAATWIVLVLLVLSTHGRNRTAGFEGGVSWGRYALTQFPAIVHYLRLCFWPHPLIFDYGSALEAPSPWVLGCSLTIAALLAATAWAVVRRPAAGFLGVAFFAILAPSSSVVPVATQTMAEHRMYLPLISVAVLSVIAIQRWLGRAALPCCLILAAILFTATRQRNGVYRTALGLWSDTVASHPGTFRGQNNLGVELAKIPGRSPEAIAHYEEALRIKPDFADAHYNLGLELAKAPGREEEAIGQFEQAIRIRPNYPEAHNDLATALARIPGRERDAVAHYEEALTLRPDFAEAQNNLANLLTQLPGKSSEAIAHFGEALRLKPDFAEAHYNLAVELARHPGRLPEAIVHYREALRLNPRSAAAHNNLAIAYARTGRAAEAIEELKTALRIDPGYQDAQRNLQVLQTAPSR